MEEYPKWVKGQLVDSREAEAALLGVAVADLPEWVAPNGASNNTPAGYEPVEYPKWVEGKLVNSAEEELALLESLAPPAEVVADEAPRRPVGRPPKVAVEA